MRKLGIRLIIVTLLLIVSLVVIQKTTAGIQPLADWIFKTDSDYYFVKIEEDNDEKLWNGKYRYTFNGYDKDGNLQHVVKVVNRKLRPDAYIKIYADGSYGEGWGEVAAEDIPPEVLKKINK